MTQHLSILDDLYEEYEVLDKFDRYRMLIELGRAMEPMSEVLKTDATLVQGCSSNVWVYPTVNDNKDLHFFADSNSEITKGVIALILTVVQDQSPSDVSKSDIEGTIARFELQRHLTSNRTQGIPNMIALIRQTATRYTA